MQDKLQGRDRGSQKASKSFKLNGYSEQKNGNGVCVSLCVYGEQIKLTDAPDSVKEELTRHYQLIVSCNGEEYNKNYLILGNGKAHELDIQERCSISQGQ